MELLFVTLRALPFVVAVLLAFGVALVGVTIVVRPGVACGLFVLLFFQSVLLPQMGALPIGINLYLGDIIALLVGFGAFARLTYQQRGTRLPIGLWMVGVALSVSVLLGLAKFGTTAGVAFRPYFYMVVFALYFSTYPSDEAMWRLMRRTYWVVGVFILCVVTARWSGWLDQDAGPQYAAGKFAQLDAIRVVNSVQTLMLLHLSLLVLAGQPGKSAAAMARPIAILLLGFVVVLQHRSVWLAGIAAIAASILLNRKSGSKAVFTVAIPLVLLVSVMAAFNVGGSLFGEIARSAERAIQGADSTQARLDTWDFVVKKWWAGGPSAWMIGLPFGTDLERFAIGSDGGLQKLSFQAHNFYVQTLFNAGLVGLLGFIGYFFYMLRGLWVRIRQGHANGYSALTFILLVSLVVYFLTYGAGFESGMLLGVALSLARAEWMDAQASRKRERATAIRPGEGVHA